MAPVTRARSDFTKSANPNQAHTNFLAAPTKIRKNVPSSATQHSKNKPKDSTSTLKPESQTPRSTDLPILAFVSPEAFNTFLSSNGSIFPGIWLKLARRNSGIQFITTQEALEDQRARQEIAWRGRGELVLGAIHAPTSQVDVVAGKCPACRATYRGGSYAVYRLSCD